MHILLKNFALGMFEDTDFLYFSQTCVPRLSEQSAYTFLIYGLVSFFLKVRTELDSQE